MNKDRMKEDIKKECQDILNKYFEGENMIKKNLLNIKIIV